jgi:integrase
MAGAWVTRRTTASGETRYRVRYRLGGRSARLLYAGSFTRKEDARARARWIEGELAAMRVPDLSLIAPDVVTPPTVAEIAERWQATRVGVADTTATTYTVNLSRILPALRDRPACEIRPADVQELVAHLRERGLARESIRKTLSTFAQVLDFAEVHPNPVRHKSVELPPNDREEVNPPDAATVTAAFQALAPTYRLPLLVLDATGMRITELESLRWGDVDERAGRWRVSRRSAKTRQARWVPVPENVLQAVTETVHREDRDLGGQVFAGFDGDRFRTALGRACKAAGVPLISPHDLRHRRATLWHLSGMPVAEAAGWLGHSAQEHLRTYAHATLDRAEIDVPTLLESVTDAHPVFPLVFPRKAIIRV